MRTITSFVVKHWLTLGLLAGSLVLVTWIVQTKRPPGAMTLIEAQSMDMTQMRPPTGVLPVAFEEAQQKPVGSSVSYPAEVFAYSDEDVVARIMGRIDRVLVYPGDHVRAGQLLATLQADETAAMAGESRLMAAAKSNMALAAQREIDEQRAMLAKSKAGVTSAQASVAHSEADLEAMKAERQKASRELDMSRAEIDQMRADLAYAEQEYGRSQTLYKKGAISLDELQASQRERDGSAAKVRSAESKARASEEAVQVAEKRVNASQKMLEEARAMVVAAQSEREQAAAGVNRAGAAARGASSEAASARAGASGLATMAGYRELRALADGDVSERTLSPGTVVMPGTTVLKLKVLSKVRVQADLPQSLSASVHVGTPITIVSDAIRREAKVTSVFPVVAPDSRTFRIEAIVDNAGGSIKPGMFLHVQIDLSEAVSQLAVRSTAVLTDADGGRYLWVVKEGTSTEKPTDWTCTMHPEVSMPGPGICPKCKMELVPRGGSGKFVVEKRDVEVGASDGTYTAITSGLKSGEEVVWAGHKDLYPGAPVAKAEWGPNGPVSLEEATKALGGDGKAHQNEGSGDMPGMKMGGGS